MASAATTKTRNQTISAQSRLKFRPAESKLAQQLRDAATALDTGIASAHSVAATITQAAQDAIPKLTAAVGQQQTLSDKLRAVAPALDPNSGFGKAAAIETSGAAQRLGELKTNAVADYIGQQARARQGEAFQISNLRNQNQVARDRIGQQAIDLKAQEGDYSASLKGQYAAKDLQNAFSRAQQQRSFSHSDQAAATRQAAADARAGAKTDKAAKTKADKRAAAQAKADSARQKAFTQQVAKLGLSTRDAQVPDPKNPGQKKTVAVPMTQDYAAARRQQLEAAVRASGLSAEMARRVVDAYIAVGTSDPGSYKKYRLPKSAGGAITQGAAGLPAHPFG